MKAGKKTSARVQRRTAMHHAAIEARKKKGISEPEKGFRFPGSMNAKKTAPKGRK